MGVELRDVLAVADVLGPLKGRDLELLDLRAAPEVGARVRRRCAAGAEAEKQEGKRRALHARYRLPRDPEGLRDGFVRGRAGRAGLEGRGFGFGFGLGFGFGFGFDCDFAGRFLAVAARALLFGGRLAETGGAGGRSRREGGARSSFAAPSRSGRNDAPRSAGGGCAARSSRLRRIASWSQRRSRSSSLISGGAAGAGDAAGAGASGVTAAGALTGADGGETSAAGALSSEPALSRRISSARSEESSLRASASSSSRVMRRSSSSIDFHSSRTRGAAAYRGRGPAPPLRPGPKLIRGTLSAVRIATRPPKASPRQ